MNTVKYVELTEYIVRTLDVHLRFVESAIRVPLKEILDLDNEVVMGSKNSTVSTRLLNLYWAVQYYDAMGLSGEAMTECLRTACFADHKGRMDSFVTANMQDKYDEETLMSIAKMALSEYQRKRFASDSLVKRVTDQIMKL